MRGQVIIMRVLLLGHGIVRGGVLCRGRWASVIWARGMSKEARRTKATRRIVFAWNVSCHIGRGQMSVCTVLAYRHRRMLVVCRGSICDGGIKAIVVCRDRIVAF